jgi:hypothetical protein
LVEEQKSKLKDLKSKLGSDFNEDTLKTLAHEMQTELEDIKMVGAFVTNPDLNSLEKDAPMQSKVFGFMKDEDNLLNKATKDVNPAISLPDIVMYIKMYWIVRKLHKDPRLYICIGAYFVLLFAMVFYLMIYRWNVFGGEASVVGEVPQ